MICEVPVSRMTWAEACDFVELMNSLDGSTGWQLAARSHWPGSDTRQGGASKAS